MDNSKKLPPFSRRDVLRFGCASLALSTLGGISGCASASPLKVAVQPWCGYQFLFLAQQEGLISPDQIQLIETKTNFDSISILKQGQVEAAALTLDEVLLQREQGLKLSVVGILDISAGADVLLAKPEFKTLADLRGRRIGVENTALGKLMLGETLQAAGLEKSDVTVVNMEEDHVSAWNRGGMDAILTYAPALGLLEAQGLTRLIDTRQLPQLIIDLLAVRSEVMEQHAGNIRSLLNAHFHALGLWRQSPANAMYPLAQRLGVNPNEVAKVFSGLDLPDLDYNRSYLTPPAKTLLKSAEEITRILTREGVLKKALDQEKLFVADYLPSKVT